MKKIVRFLTYYLMYCFPFVIAILASNIIPSNIINHHGFIWEIISFGFMSWCVVLFLFLLCMIISPIAREMTLKRLANLKERDEREELITGKAARTTYISMLSVMIFLLFFSLFQIKLGKLLPKDQVIYGHGYELKMSVGYSFFNKPKINNISNAIVLFDSEAIFPSSASIMLILLAWQLISFNLAARKEINNT